MASSLQPSAIPCVVLHPLHLIESFGFWWSCPAMDQLLCRGSQLQWEAGNPQTGFKRSREGEREWQVCFPGWLSHADGLLPPKRILKMTFFPFLYARACSRPTVSCFKEPTLLPVLHPLSPCQQKKRKNEHYFYFSLHLEPARGSLSLTTAFQHPPDDSRDFWGPSKAG